MFERSYSFGLPNNQGPAAETQNLYLSDERKPRNIEAWLSNFGSSNVHIFSGQLSLAQCQELLGQGFLDVIMTVTGAGPSCVRLPDDTSTITVMFEALNSSGQTQVVTVRVYES